MVVTCPQSQSQRQDLDVGSVSFNPHAQLCLHILIPKLLRWASENGMSPDLLGRGCFLEEGVHELDQGREVSGQVQGGEQGRPPGGSLSKFKERGQGAPERLQADSKGLAAL